MTAQGAHSVGRNCNPPPTTRCPPATCRPGPRCSMFYRNRVPELGEKGDCRKGDRDPELGDYLNLFKPPHSLTSHQAVTFPQTPPHLTTHHTAHTATTHDHERAPTRIYHFLTRRVITRAL
eukprot:scaffold83011_cov63-Phaeocystis_antarctica.AAC.4